MTGSGDSERAKLSSQPKPPSDQKTSRPASEAADWSMSKRALVR